MPQVPTRVELATGVCLDVVEQGDRHGMPLLLLHGVTDSWRSYETVLEHLPASTRALAISQRGHGDSDRPSLGYRTRDFAADIVAFMDRAGIDRAVLVGHSMGSANAMRIAIDHPERTLGVVLLGAFATFRGNASIVEFVDEAIGALVDPIDREFVRAFQASTLAAPIDASHFETVVAESMKVPAFVWRAAFAGLLEDDFAADLGAIVAPTTLVWGDADGVAPHADQESILGAIRGSRIRIHSGAGHGVHWERPRQVADDLIAFVDRLRDGL